MEKSLMELLMEIPKGATSATVQGVAMQMIDNNTRQKMLQSDPQDDHIHECILANGIFIADMRDCQLLSLYKVR